MLRSFDVPRHRSVVRRTADSKSFLHLDNSGVLWQPPIDGSAPTPVITFTTSRIFNFAFSAGGSQLALSRGTINSDVVLIENQK